MSNKVNLLFDFWSAILTLGVCAYAARVTTISLYACVRHYSMSYVKSVYKAGHQSILTGYLNIIMADFEKKIFLLKYGITCMPQRSCTIFQARTLKMEKLIVIEYLVI